LRRSRLGVLLITVRKISKVYSEFEFLGYLLTLKAQYMDLFFWKTQNIVFLS